MGDSNTTVQKTTLNTGTVENNHQGYTLGGFVTQGKAFVNSIIEKYRNNQYADNVNAAGLANGQPNSVWS